MAQVAVPLDKGGVGLLDHKVVGAASGLGHCDVIPESGVMGTGAGGLVLVLRLMLAGSV
jgi:hypothetical protein